MGVDHAMVNFSLNPSLTPSPTMINHDATPVDGGMRPDYQQRMQWPHASMTREVFVEHQHGRLLHRDVDVVEHEGALTFAGRFGHARSRQDAPNGWPSGMRFNNNNIGAMMIEPPSASLSGDAKTTVVAPPPTSGIHMTYRWQAFRGNERGHETPSELMVVPPWRSIRDYNKMHKWTQQTTQWMGSRFQASQGVLEQLPDHCNSYWSWTNGYDDLRIYVATDRELNFFQLRWPCEQ